MEQPVFVGSEIYRRSAFGRNHPLSIARVERVADLCRALHWLPEEQFAVSPVATRKQLEWFHEPGYLDALLDAEKRGRTDAATRKRYGFGTMENPLFDGLFERASTSVGGSIRAAQLALNGRVAFHPAGGTHHALKDRARGFCYFNDPVFSVLTFLRAGLTRVMYLDLDAHHGDGVQLAFATDSRVRTISVHEADRWPKTGLPGDTGDGYAMNLPVPRNCNDDEFDRIVTDCLIPQAERYQPEAIVMTCGADACLGDPLSQMQLSNRIQWSAISRLAELSERVVVLGGGGYNPWTLIRYWTGLWGTLAGKRLPAQFDDQAAGVFDGLECDLIDDEDIDPQWTRQLVDPPNHGPVRDVVLSMLRTVLNTQIQAHWCSESPDPAIEPDNLLSIATTS